MVRSWLRHRQTQVIFRWAFPSPTLIQHLPLGLHRISTSCYSYNNKKLTSECTGSIFREGCQRRIVCCPIVVFFKGNITEMLLPGSKPVRRQATR